MAASRTRGTRATGPGFTRLTCDTRQANGDGCPSPTATPRDGETAALLRKFAHQEGWSRSGGKDYCPECTQRRNA